MSRVLWWLLFCYVIGVAARPLVREVQDKAQFDKVLAHHALTGLPVVVDYYSPSCGPCRMIAPAYEQMAKQYRDKVVFLKVNVQSAGGGVAQGVRSMPTFRFFFYGKKKHEFSGGDEGQLRTWVAKLSKAKRKTVHPATDKHDLKKILRDASKVPVVVSFVSPENEASKALWPAIKDKAHTLQGKLIFVKVNVDTDKGAAKAAKVSPDDVPVVQFYVAGKRVRELQAPTGAEAEEAIETLFKEHGTKQREAGSSGGSKKRKKKDNDEDTPAPPAAAPKPKRPVRRTATRIASQAPEQVIILGAGPAGLSAAIYASRAGLRPLVIAPQLGGQLTYTKQVENYPALYGLHATGEGLVDLMRLQAEQFGVQFEATVVVEVDLSQQPFSVVTNQTDLADSERRLYAHSLVLATGADSKWLGVAGEARLRAKGISTCATCDGFLFKGGTVMVVGGGDSAMEEALYMARITKKVFLAHRRDAFRASKILQNRVMQNSKIEVLFNRQVQEFVGEEFLTHVRLEDVGTGETEDVQVDAAFVAIGHHPNTDLFTQLRRDQTGYIETTPGSTHTSIPGVFAAGDVADPIYRQAVTSAGSGAMAALDAEKWLDAQDIPAFEEDYSTWSVKQLRQALKDHDISHKDCLEKRDFIDKLNNHVV